MRSISITLQYALMFSLLTIVGCSSLRDFLGFGYARPKVTLRGIDVKKVTFTKVELEVTLRVKNPNSFDLALDRLDYQVIAMGLDLAVGKYEQPFRVKAESRADVSLPFTLNTQNAFKIFKRLSDEPNSDGHHATVNANVVFDSPIGKIEQSFTDKRAIGLPGFN